MSTLTDPYVIIVGAGPSGLLLSLLLTRSGVPVHLLDASTSLDTNPRATHYGAPAIHELSRAGVLGEVRAQGFHPNTMCWRKLDGTYITGFRRHDVGGEAARDKDRQVCLPLNRLGEILLKELLRVGKGKVKVSWGFKVVGTEQNGEEAWVDVETPEGPKRLKARYVVGCDGGNSAVRKSLFGNEFPGMTWDVQLVATNTYYDFEKYGYSDTNFIIDQEHFYMAAKISKDGMWRCTYADKAGLSREELLARQPAKFEAMLPGHPKPDSGAYKITNISPYKVHQRCVSRMRVGRVLLAADAAHLCNPFGGMGLTGGIVDVGNLYDCLYGIYTDQADDTILDKYDEIRRKMYHEIVDPVSSSNIKRLSRLNPDKALEEDEFLQTCKKAETDVDLSVKMQLRSRALMHDFTQYYHKNGSTQNGQADLIGSIPDVKGPIAPSAD